MLTSYHTIFLYFAAALTTTLALYAYHRRQAPGALPFAGIFLAMSIWSCAYAFELNSTSVNVQIFWMKITYFGILTLPLAWALFALQYAGRHELITRRTVTLAVLPPLISLAFIWTNGVHGLFWRQITRVSVGSSFTLELSYGPAFWVHVYYAYLLIVYGGWSFLHETVGRQTQYRPIVLVLLVGLSIPLIANILSVSRLKPVPYLDLTPYAFIITALMTLWLVLRYRFLEIVPLAQHVIMEAMDEGLLITDYKDRIVYLNQAASSLFESVTGGAEGKSITQVISNWNDIISIDPSEGRSDQAGSLKTELSLVQEGVQKHYELRITTLHAPYGTTSGRLITFRDLTERKQTEYALRRQLDELIVLHAVATACVEAKSEDALIGHVTHIIGESLYPNNFGLMLLDRRSSTLHYHSSYQENTDIQSSPITLGAGITGKVAQEGEAWNVPDVSQEPAYIEADPNTKSELCVPLKVGERVIGVINVESIQIEAFSQADERLLGIIAGQLSTAIERLRAEKGIQKRVQELQAITHISSEVSTVLDQQQLLGLIARHAAEISNCDGCGIFTLHPDGRLHLDAAHGVGEDFTSLLRTKGVPMEGTAVGRAYTSLQPCQIPDIYDEKETYATVEIADMEGIRSLLAIPMRRGEEVIGGIVLWHRQPRRFSVEEERFLQALANQSVNALENARLFERERQQRQLAEILRDTGSALSATLDFDRVLDRLLEQLAFIVPYDAANVMVVEEAYACIARLKIQTTSGQSYYQAANNLRIDIASTENLRLMVENRAPVIIPDVKSDEMWQDFIENSPVRSWAGAPILIENKVIAFFGLDSLTKGFFRPEHLKPLEIFASQAGLALQNALLFEETQRRLREITLLSKIIQLTSSVEDPETALNQACQEIAAFFSSQLAALALMQPEQDQITVIAEYLDDPSQPSMIGVSIPISNNPGMAYLLEHRSPQAVSDLQEDPDLEPVRELFQFRNTASALFIPLLSQGEVIGVLSIGTRERRTFNSEEIELTQNLSRQASQALDRLQLYNEARSQAERMASLAVLSGELNRPMSVDEVIQGIGRGAMTLGGTARAAVFLHGFGETIYCPWFEGLSGQYLKAVTEQEQGSPQNIFADTFLKKANAVLIRDIRELPEQTPLRLLAEGEGYRGMGLFPLVYEGTVMATVGLYYDQPRPWVEPQKEIMLAFIRQAAVALQTARLFDETLRRALQQEALNAVVAAGVAAPNLSILLNTVLDLTLHALGMDKGAIWIREHHAIRGFPEDIGLESRQFARGQQGIRPQTIALNDLYRGMPGDLPDDWKAHLEKHDVHALLTVPVMTGGERIGAMSIASPVPHKWLEEEIALAQAVGRQLGSATERFELVARSQEQARQVQQIIETVPEGVLVLDYDRRITLANPAAQSYLAVLNPKHSLDAPLRQLGGITIRELLVTQREKPWRELKTDSAPSRIFEIAARPLETRSLKEGWVLVLRDVTLERENQTRAQMRERLATVGQLAAGIAHDFNNIMAAIVVYADLLSMEPGLSRDGRERLRTIQQQITRASDLIRQILDFSRRSVMERSPLDLLPLIKELEKLLGRVLPENIQRELIYEPGAYMVNADPTHLQQVFMNLALNARDAMPSGGALTISLAHVTITQDEPLPAQELSPGNWICVTLRDTGTGIPAEALPHIFDPFFTTKPVGQGTGLGLAQVYGIIQQHGGVIDVHSGKEEGTTFHIYLPELVTSEDAAKIPLPEVSQRGAGETLLLVEDDQPARKALQELLENQGYNILIAGNGVEAVRVFEENAATIEMVISDVVMPKMGGIELYHSLKKSRHGIKFLLITGHPLEVHQQVPLEKGMVEWLHKPFPVNEFLAVVQNLLEA